MTINAQAFSFNNGSNPLPDSINGPSITAQAGNAILVQYTIRVGSAYGPITGLTWNNQTFQLVNAKTTTNNVVYVFKLFVTTGGTAQLVAPANGWNWFNCMAIVCSGSIAAANTFSAPVVSFRDGSNGSFVAPSNTISTVVSGDLVVSMLAACDQDQGDNTISTAQTFTDGAGQTGFPSVHNDNPYIGYAVASTKSGAGDVTMSYALNAQPKYVLTSIIVRGDSNAATIDSAGTSGVIVPGANNPIAKSNMGALTAANIGRLNADSLPIGQVHFPAMANNIQFELFGMRTLTATDGIKSANFNADFSPPSGFNFITLEDPINTTVASMFEGSTGQLAGGQVAFPTANFTTVDVHGIVETSLSGTQTFYYIDPNTAMMTAINFTTGGADTTPNTITFTNTAGAVASSSNQSNEITISGITSQIAFAVTGGQFAVDTGSGYGAFSSTTQQAQNGWKIKLQGTASGTAGGVTSVGWTAGTASGTWTITTASSQPDTTPNSWTFNTPALAALGATVTSNAATPTGYNAAAAVSVTGGQVSINSGAFVSSGTISPGQTIAVRVTASNSYSTGVTATVTIGGVSANFTATTIADPGQPADTTPNSFTIPATTNAAANTAITSQAVTPTGYTSATAISVTGGFVTVAGVANATTISPGQSFTVTVQSSSTPSAQATATVTVGGVQATYVVSASAGSGTPGPVPPLASGALVEEITARVQFLVNDPNGDAYPAPAIWDFIYDAEQTIANTRPDALNKTAAFTCTDGSRQDLSGTFSDAVNFLDAHSIVLSGGDLGGVVRRVSMRDLDAIRPKWRTATRTNSLREFMHDKREPLIFHVNPPALSGAQLLISYSARPTAYPNVDETTRTSVGEQYLPMIMDWVLYRCFSKDEEGSVNSARALAYRKSFYEAMGIKDAAEDKAGPKNLEHKR